MHFDNRSLVLNDEVTLIVLDPAFGARMESNFADDLRYAKGIDAATFSKRRWMEHLAE
jgi:cardiolipin synthase A/B